MNMNTFNKIEKRLCVCVYVCVCVCVCVCYTGRKKEKHVPIYSERKLLTPVDCWCLFCMYFPNGKWDDISNALYRLGTYYFCASILRES